MSNFLISFDLKLKIFKLICLNYKNHILKVIILYPIILNQFDLPPSFLRDAENETIDVWKRKIVPNVASLSRASNFLEKHF